MYHSVSVTLIMLYGCGVKTEVGVKVFHSSIMMRLMLAALACVGSSAFIVKGPVTQGTRPLVTQASTRQPPALRRMDIVVSSAPLSALQPPEPPTTARLAKFAFPALALWLAGPLLSLVDTSAVGLSAPPGTGALHIAALGPATTFCDGSIYMFAFLNVATTNLYATAKASAVRPDGTSDATEAVVRRAAKIALSCSAVLVPFLIAFARPLLALYMGPTAASNPELIGPASAYVLIRCCSFPASLLGGVLTASLLGAQDSVTPLIATAAATATNIVLDVIAVALLGLGLAGAAAATLVAQWVCALVLWRRARARLLGPQGLALAPAWLRMRHGPEGSGGRSDAAAVSTGRFLVFAAPVLCLILGKIAAYGFLTHVAAELGAVSLAAHQIALSLFFFLTSFLEIVAQTAQTFLPAFSAPPEGANVAEWRAASDALVNRLLRYVLVLAVAGATIAVGVLVGGTRCLTNDLTVRLAVRPLAAPLAASYILCGPLALAEGVLLARRQLKFLASVYIATVALLPPALIAAKQRGGPIVLVWTIFAVFNLCRAILFGARVWGSQLLERRSASAAIKRK